MHPDEPSTDDGEGPSPALTGPTCTPFPIVGVGASAGGVEALSRLLSHLPERTGMAFVLVQHLDPKLESRLPEVLARATRMPVLEGQEGMAVSPDHVYVIPPNADLTVADGQLHLSPRSGPHLPHLPVDHLFRSLADVQQAHSIGVVLSGTGSDGTQGLAEIKAVGGITFAQDEQSAQYVGMPHSAIDNGCVDFVLAPEQIALRLAEIGSHSYLAPAADTPEPESDSAVVEDDKYQRILSAVRNATRVDFSQYRDTTIRRRIMRRMALRSMDSPADYAGLLEADRAEVEALYRDLLINVTSFFRDPAMFAALKRDIFPALMDGKPPSPPLRVWVPGCSTGQEAYSLAIALREFFDDKPLCPPIEIFATDLGEPSTLNRARSGLYPESIEAEVSSERLRRFFGRVDHQYRVDKTIRDTCIFAHQNIAADPPISHVDLISCRNVLIYMAPSLKKHVLPTFHYALNVPGYLILGPAETVGEFSDLFEPVDRTYKIYAKKATASRPIMQFVPDGNALTFSAARKAAFPIATVADYQREADRLVLGDYAPSGVLVNENLDIVQFRGRTTPYLEPPPGEPTANVLRMAREGLFMDLRNALSEARSSGRAVHRSNVTIRDGREVRTIRLRVLPVKLGRSRGGCLLVLFEDTPDIGTGAEVANGIAGPGASRPVSEASATNGASSDGRELDQFRQELAATREYLLSMMEQQDASNEELRSANEEILSSNEELQSTNEELEAAKEELQSTNEELTTVNEQLQNRNLELNQLTDDLSNLLTSITIPVVMVGADLRIRHFTPAANKIMNLLPGDIGRPVLDINFNVEVPDLEKLIAGVIDEVRVREREVRDRGGTWYMLRIYPYRSADDRIDGAVIVLLDIDASKRAQEALRQADRRKDEFLAVLGHELRNPLSAIYNALHAIRRSDANPEPTELEARETLERQTSQLLRIVNDLLDMSRIVQGKIELRKERVALASVVQTALQTSRPLIETRRHTLTVTLPPEPVWFEADPVRLAQILSNLLDNAAKFTRPGGEIALTVRRQEAAGPASGTLQISVRDNGIGIPAALLAGIFDLFSQGAQSADDGLDGLGVGLNLARKLAELHGGRIEAKSEGPGKGAEFIVTLPLAAPPQQDSAPARQSGTHPPVARRRVLLVDDDKDVAASMRSLVAALGHEVRVVHDGESAAAAAHEFAPDLALIDIAMPDISGYEVAQRFRRDPGLSAIVLAALTGHGTEEDRFQAREAGFDYHLVKPVNIAFLEKLLANLDQPE